MTDETRKKLEDIRAGLESHAVFGCEGDYDGTCVEFAETAADWCGRCVAGDAASAIEALLVHDSEADV